MEAQQLQKVLTTPAKIASKLDWKKATTSKILSLDIRKDQIGMAVASHPSLDPIAKPLDTISLSNSKNRRRIDTNFQKQLTQIVKENNVCGFVVSWPVQSDSGRSGAACGRVLFTLDQILSSVSNDNLSPVKDSPVSPGRPVCLWTADEETIPFAVREDHWGRSATYSRTCGDDEHIASKHQYDKVKEINSVFIWDDFVRANWPGVLEKTRKQQETAAATERASKAGSSREIPRRQRMPSWVGDESFATAKKATLVTGM